MEIYNIYCNDHPKLFNINDYQYTQYGSEYKKQCVNYITCYQRRN